MYPENAGSISKKLAMKMRGIVAAYISKNPKIAKFIINTKRLNGALINAKVRAFLYICLMDNLKVTKMR